MAKLTKRQKALEGKVDSNKLYPLDNALAIVKECATAKFDESIDVAVQLGVEMDVAFEIVVEQRRLALADVHVGDQRAEHARDDLLATQRESGSDQMCFAGATFADQYYGLGAIDIAAGCKFTDLSSRNDRSLGKIKIIQGFYLREMGLSGYVPRKIRTQARDPGRSCREIRPGLISQNEADL